MKRYSIYKGTGNNVQFQKVISLDMRGRQISSDLTSLILVDEENNQITLGELLTKFENEIINLRRELSEVKKEVSGNLEKVGKCLKAMLDEYRKEGII